MAFNLIKSAKFYGMVCDLYEDDERSICMTASQLADCLGYTNRRNIDKLVTRNEYLKSEEFSGVVSLSTPGGTQETRVFTEDGIYEVTMLAKTEKAREFRTFVRKLVKGIRAKELNVMSREEMQIKAQEMQFKALIAQAKADNAKARLMNAENRRMDMLSKNPDIAVQTGITKPVIKTYTATEISQIFGRTPQAIGRKSTELGLKTEKYGLFYKETLANGKEVETFRYNAEGIKALADALGVKYFDV